MPVMAGVVVMLVAGVAVAWFAVTRGSSAEQPDWGARDGTVPGLVVLDDSFKRWWVDSLDNIEPTGDPKVVGFSYSTPTATAPGLWVTASRRPHDGSFSPSCSVAAGQCQPRLAQHWGRVTLAEPLGDRRILAVIATVGRR